MNRLQRGWDDAMCGGRRALLPPCRGASTARFLRLQRSPREALPPWPRGVPSTEATRAELHWRPQSGRIRPGLDTVRLQKSIGRPACRIPSFLRKDGHASRTRLAPNLQSPNRTARGGALRSINTAADRQVFALPRCRRRDDADLKIRRTAMLRQPER